MNRVDEMFTTGPETLVARSRAIVAGSVSSYSKEVKEQSQGAAPIPIRWVISGRLERPETLKGNPPGTSLQISREERSPFLPAPEPKPAWQAAYDPWQPDDKAVAFLGNAPGEILLVLPSGTGERDLISLVRLIVKIPATASSERDQAAAWQSHLLSGEASSAESKRVALRSLMRLTRNWNDVASTWDAVMRKADANLRRYAYGIVAYGIVHENWSDAIKPAEFLCTLLLKETDTEIAEDYLQYLDLVQRFAANEKSGGQRKALGDQIRGCLQKRGAIR